MQNTVMRKRKNGQMILEYTILFVAIVAAVLLGSYNFIRPSVNRFFQSSANIIDNAARDIANRF